MNVGGSKMKIAVAMTWILIVPCTSAAWDRHVLSGKGEFVDSPAPHPLAYFTRDPFLRDDGDQFCADCSAAGKAQVHEAHKFKTELQKVGRIGGFDVFDLYYYFDDDASTGQIDWKSILVETASGQYREIFHLQPTQAMIQPAYFVDAGGEQLLATRDVIPGTGNNYYEDYWWFGPEGPVRINLEVIATALRSSLPPGYGVWKGGGLDLPHLVYRSSVWKDGDANCCPTGGTVEILFRLQGGQLVATKTEFDRKA
jgi:hypothetical protein